MADIPPSVPGVVVDPALWPPSEDEIRFFEEYGFVDPRPHGSV